MHRGHAEVHQDPSHAVDALGIEHRVEIIGPRVGEADRHVGMRHRVGEPDTGERQRGLVAVDPKQVRAAPDLESARDDRRRMSPGSQREVDDDTVRALQQVRDGLEQDGHVGRRGVARHALNPPSSVAKASSARSR